MNENKRPPLKSRIIATLALFFLSPFVGEFLLGNIPITMLWLIPVLGLLYGGGSILIREYSIRLKLRWNGILIFCLVYAIIEEGLYTQSLFDPNFFGLRLLDYGYIKGLGIGLWWTVYVLGIHIIWSTAVPIAMIEFLFPKTRNKPLLGKTGLAIITLLFIFFCTLVILARIENEFMASKMQFVVSIAVILLLIISAILIRRDREMKKVENRKAPAPITTGITSFVLSSLFMAMTFFIEIMPAELNVTGMLIFFIVGCILFWSWSKRSGWSLKHSLMLTGGLLFTYAWFGFVQVPSVGKVTTLVDTAGNIVFSCIAILLFYIAWIKVSKSANC